MTKLGVLLVTAVALTAAAPAPHKVVRNTPALDFNYEWPPEAVAIPKLDLKLYTEAKKELAEAQKYAAEGQALARQQQRDMLQHDYAMIWSVEGQTGRLLSLASALGTFSGGAHPNSNFGALLWDRKLNRSVALTALFSNPAQFAAMTRPAYCKALDAERNKRREGEKLDLPDFNACPKYSELAISPADSDKDGRFDTIRFVASPYVAGPYVEGDYEISLPVTAPLIAALKAEYRPSFSA